MLLMALDGAFGEAPDFALFADTGWEPSEVYQWLDRLEKEVAPFKITRVSHGNIREDSISGQSRTGRFVTLPCFIDNPISGDKGMGRRQCTNEYKLNPMRRYLRSLGVKQAEMWIGISTDEAIRMKPSRLKWITHRWPLIEKKLSRESCANYLRDRMGTVAPRSSCIGCPLHNDAYWIRMKHLNPEEFEDACQFDEQIRHAGRMKFPQYLHSSLKPLRQVSFAHEHQNRMFFDHFGNECEGICET